VESRGDATEYFLSIVNANNDGQEAGHEAASYGTAGGGNWAVVQFHVLCT
jgi:hypothetical protein